MNDEVSLKLDNEDYERCLEYEWYVDSQTGYWRRKLDGMTLHEFLMGKAPSGMTWDHKDGNKSNNSRSNLRLATYTQQFANVPKRTGQFTSRFKGVYRHNRKNRWIAQITVDGRAIYLGSFVDEEDAAKTYDIEARLRFGEFARTNFR